MRLDGRRGDRNWQVWHCEEARLLPHVVVVDDVLSLWVEYVFPFQMRRGELAVRVCKATRIQILTNQRLVLINPLADSQMGELPDEVALSFDPLPAAEKVREL